MSQKLYTFSRILDNLRPFCILLHLLMAASHGLSLSFGHPITISAKENDQKPSNVWQPNFPDCHHHDAWVYDNVRRLGHIHTYTGTIPFPICPSVSPPTWGSRGSLWGSFQVVVRLIYFGRKLLERALYRTICIWTFCSSSDPMYWILKSLPFVFYKDPSNPRWCHQSNQKFGWPYKKKQANLSVTFAKLIRYMYIFAWLIERNPYEYYSKGLFLPSLIWMIECI